MFLHIGTYPLHDVRELIEVDRSAHVGEAFSERSVVEGEPSIPHLRDAPCKRRIVEATSAVAWRFANPSMINSKPDLRKSLPVWAVGAASHHGVGESTAVFVKGEGLIAVDNI